MLDSSFSLLLQAHVEQWIDFSTTAVDAPLCSWVYPLLGFMPFDKKVGGALQKQGLVQNLMGLENPIVFLYEGFSGSAAQQEACLEPVPAPSHVRLL